MNAQELIKFYFSFDGRATRRDFNVRFALVAVIGTIVAGMMDFFIVNKSMITMEFQSPFSDIWSFITLISMFAVTCRRLHDMNYSGWWQVLAHVFTALCVAILVMTVGLTVLIDPVVGGASGLIALVAVLVFYLIFFIFISMKRGTVGPNLYGPDPLEVQHVGQ